jgi:hypothetical protein
MGSRPESQLLSVAVTVCTASSLLDQVTVVPAGTVTSPGKKAYCWIGMRPAAASPAGAVGRAPLAWSKKRLAR